MPRDAKNILWKLLWNVLRQACTANLPSSTAPHGRCGCHSNFSGYFVCDSWDISSPILEWSDCRTFVVTFFLWVRVHPHWGEKKFAWQKIFDSVWMHPQLLECSDEHAAATGCLMLRAAFCKANRQPVGRKYHWFGSQANSLTRHSIGLWHLSRIFLPINLEKKFSSLISLAIKC